MERTASTSWTLVICVLYIWTTADTGVFAGDKCSGDYAKQSCFGGNGKRSDPNAFGGSESRPSSRLLQVLAKGLQEMRRADAGTEWDNLRPRTDEDDGDFSPLEPLNALERALVQQRMTRQMEDEEGAQDEIRNQLSQQYGLPERRYDTSNRQQYSNGRILSQILTALKRRLEETRTGYEE